MSREVEEQPVDQEPYLSPFDDLTTKNQQTKYFKEYFGLIVSVYILAHNS